MVADKSETYRVETPAPAIRCPHYNTLRARVAELEDTLAAWEAKIENPEMAIQWQLPFDGKWRKEHSDVSDWEVEVARRITPELAATQTTKGKPK